MSNFSFKGDISYRLIPSGGIDLFIPSGSLMGGIQYHGTPIPGGVSLVLRLHERLVENNTLLT